MIISYKYTDVSDERAASNMWEPWWWRQLALLKRRSASTTLHSGISHLQPLFCVFVRHASLIPSVDTPVALFRGSYLPTCVFQLVARLLQEAGIRVDQPADTRPTAKRAGETDSYGLSNFYVNFFHEGLVIGRNLLEYEQGRDVSC
jgi:hypothetical protein